MARAYRGPYSRPSQYAVPYATAAVWGTGIDAIHSYYGEGPPVRALGRPGTSGSSPVASGEAPRDRAYQQPADQGGFNPPEELTWGYPVDYTRDSFGQGADAPMSHWDTAPERTWFNDDHPTWGEDTERQRNRMRVPLPPWNRGGEAFRARRLGAQGYRLYQQPGSAYAPITQDEANSLPSETVSEGWLNKATSSTAYAEPSDPSQYEVQTSMRQRFGTRNNDRAVMRSTDDPRAKIASRVMAMVEKVYSTGERSYDMFPYQQDQINRPFRYRTAGTGRQAWMETNAYSALTAVQRTPPPDPAMGVPEVQSEDYGYTGEDSMYYG
jgi:hypothetical protein